MPSVASIKGSIFASVVEDVNKLVTGGKISVKELTHWLQPTDFDLLHQEISVSEWYDIRAYERMNLLLRDVTGGGKNEYLRRLGKESARRLLESGLYQQMEYLNKMKLHEQTDQKLRFEAYGRDLRLLTTLSRSLLNFSKQAVKMDPQYEYRYLLEYTEAKDIPEVYCWRADGFVNQMAMQNDEPDRWRWERPTPDRIVFYMRRPI
jgi:hypothetical protein